MFNSLALAASAGGRDPANMSSILLIKAMVAKDLMIIFRFGSLMNVNIRANTVKMELNDYMPDSKIFIKRPLILGEFEFNLFKKLRILIEFSKSFYRFS